MDIVIVTRGGNRTIAFHQKDIQKEKEYKYLCFIFVEIVGICCHIQILI